MVNITLGHGTKLDDSVIRKQYGNVKVFVSVSFQKTSSINLAPEKNVAFNGILAKTWGEKWSDSAESAATES